MSARPCRQSETCTCLRRCGRLHVRLSRNSGSSLHTEFSPVLPQFCQQVHSSGHAQFCGTTSPQTGFWVGHIFTDGSSSGCGALRRAGWAVVAVDDVGHFKAAAYGAVPSDVLSGQTSRDGEDDAAATAGHTTPEPLTLHIDCEGIIATVNGPKCRALGAGGPRAHVWSRLLVSHDEVRAVKVKGHATERDVQAAHFPSVQKEKRLCRHFCKERDRHTHKPAFRVAKTVVACASLAKQAALWAAEAHVLLRFRGWNDTRVAAARPRARLPRASAALASGQVCDSLSPIVPTRFSKDSLLDPRTFRGHSLQLGRVFDSGGRALDRAIIFCAICGAVYWERADAVCHSCSELPEGRTSQLRKLRSGLFPNKRYPGWTVEHHPGRGDYFGGAAGILRRGFGPNHYGSLHFQEATCGPAGSATGIHGTHCRGGHNGEPGAAALGPGAAEFTGGVWAPR